MRGSLLNVVRPAQLSVLALQQLQLDQLVSRRAGPATGVLLSLADPQPDGLGLRSQLLRDRTDRFPLPLTAWSSPTAPGESHMIAMSFASSKDHHDNDRRSESES